MNNKQLRDRYCNAHAIYLQYRDTNQTNNIESEFLPQAREFLKKYFDMVVDVGPGFLNYSGVDFIVNKGEETFTVDLKVCQHLEQFYCLVDARKKDENLNWVNALDTKISDYFLFINKHFIFLVHYSILYEKIEKLRDDQLFFMKRDLRQTTKKARVFINPDETTYIEEIKRTV